MENNKHKIRIAVVYGGQSGEHEISLLSAASVIKHLDRNKFEVIPIAIDRDGSWYLNDLNQVFLPEQGVLKVKSDSSTWMPVPQSTQPAPVLASRGKFDVVFPVLHGPRCEDGTIQGLLELADVPYVGAGVLGSAVAMDKDVMKRLVSQQQIRTPEHIAIKAADYQHDQQACLARVKALCDFPVFVKPARLGSSVGIHRVEQFAQLAESISDALRYDSKVIVEAAQCDIQEIELSVLENSQYGAPPLVSTAGEIRVGGEHGFYSYAAKYLDDKGAELVIPAQITPQQLLAAQQMARDTFNLLECEGMARVDLFVDKKTGELIFNEINTIPGFTSISMYPKLWAASGIEYSKLLTMLIELALARHERNKLLKRDYC